MSFTKHATFQIIAAQMAPATGGLRVRTAHRHSFDYEPTPGFLYVRSRAISSRTNDNFDSFPAEEIKQAYHTFIGKPVFVNHNNADHRRSRGVIVDAALHEDTNPDGSADTWVEVLMEVDAVKFPKLAEAIVKGKVNRTSMGTDVKYSVCSFCGNRAENPMQYCAHIPRLKGKRIYRVEASTGKREAVLVHEMCYGLGFFENSILVEPPADPTAYFLGVDERGMQTTAGKTALEMNLCPDCGTAFSYGETTHEDHAESVKRRDEQRKNQQTYQQHHSNKDPRFEGVGLDQDEDGWYVKTHRARSDSYPTPEAIPQSKVDFIESTGKKALFFDEQPNMSGKACEACTGRGELPYNRGECGVCKGTGRELIKSEPVQEEPRVRNPDRYQVDRAAHLHGKLSHSHHNDMDGHRHPNAREGAVHTAAPVRSRCGAHGLRDYDGIQARDGNLVHVFHCAGGEHDDGMGEVHVPYTGTLRDEELDDSEHMMRSAALPKGKNVSEYSESELAEHKEHVKKQSEEGKAWVAKHGKPDPKHVVAHWDAATHDEKEQGKNWYQDAHHLTKHIANDTGHDMHTASALMSIYSPQTHWATNIHTAARVMRGKKGIGGKGSGVMASEKQKSAANRAMGTEGHAKENHDQILKGPKTHAFAHLIEHGGNKDKDDPKVVVDRHAMSVAVGKRAPDSAYINSGLGGKKKYKEYADTYHEAAKHISKRDGVHVEAHQVQAATWLARQRLNEHEDKTRMADAGKKGSGAAARARRAVNDWNSYAGEHHPGAMGKEPGTGYSKTQDAPDDVQHAQDMKGEGRPVQKVAGHYLGEFGDVPAPHAPADVDTLRSEACPVCGEDESWDGQLCQVCGFDAPLPQFDDPDTSLHRDQNPIKDADMADQVGDGPEMKVQEGGAY